MDVEGFQFVVDRELFEKASPITVDMSYLGFQVSSNMNLGGGSCSSSSCGGSC